MPPIYLSESDVGRLVTIKDAMAALEALFATWGQPSTTNLPRQRAPLPGGAFNLMGAAYGAKGVHGLKAYAGVKGAQFHALLETHQARDGAQQRRFAGAVRSDHADEFALADFERQVAQDLRLVVAHREAAHFKQRHARFPGKPRSLSGS